MRPTYSPFIVRTFVLLGLIGLIYGIYMDANRPTSYPPNDPANDAIGLHIVLAIIVLGAVLAIQTYRSKRRLPNIWLALFSQRAFKRLMKTMSPERRTPVSILRAVVCILPLYLILWNPFRSAMQIFAAFDPSVRANAWGGPTYLGATLAHWLDGTVLMYVGAVLLHILMARDSPDRQHSLK